MQQFIIICIAWFLTGAVVNAIIHDQFESGYKYNKNQLILAWILFGPFVLFWIGLLGLIELFKEYDTGDQVIKKTEPKIAGHNPGPPRDRPAPPAAPPVFGGYQPNEDLDQNNPPGSE